MRMKENNKGFSLVELIVVMAIMAILAVTLAPRLMHYIDKARQTNDREVVNTVYTAVKYALVDDELYNDITVPTTTPIAVLSYYARSGNSYSVDTDATNSDFSKEITSVVGNFKLQSDLATDDSKINLKVYSQDHFIVELSYNGTSVDYTVNSNEAIPIPTPTPTTAP